MKKIMGIILAVCTVLVGKTALACMCDGPWNAWERKWHKFADSFILTGGKITSVSELLGTPGTMLRHASIQVNGVVSIRKAIEASSNIESYSDLHKKKTDLTAKATTNLDRDHADRMAKQQMELQALSMREQTLLQDSGRVEFSSECPDLEHAHAAYANTAQENLMNEKQKGREAMRHKPGQATDVIKDRRDAAEQYQKALSDAQAHEQSTSEEGKELTLEPSAKPQNGMLVFSTNDLYLQTRNITRKLVELDRPLEDAKKLNLNKDHENEYLALRDARKMISNMRAEGLEMTIDWYAPTMDRYAIDFLSVIQSPWKDKDNSHKYINKEDMTSMAAESEAYYQVQLSAAMAEHLNSDNAGPETALLMTHIFALERRRTQMLQLLAAMLASEDVMPRIDRYLSNIRMNSGEQK